MVCVRKVYTLEVMNEVVSSVSKLLLKLPKPDLLVLIHPERIETVLSRIKMRKRFNVDEELDRNYVEFVVNYLYKLFVEVGRELAEKTCSSSGTRWRRESGDNTERSENFINQKNNTIL